MYAREARVEPVESKADKPSATLATLELSNSLVRGMYLTLVTELQSQLLELKWTYGCLF